MATKLVQDSSLTSVANAIRVKAEISGTLEFPDEFVSAIQNISTGITPSGTKTITENGTYDVTNFASADVNVSGGSGDHDAEDALIDRTISGVYENSRVTWIGSYAFNSCTDLTAVSFPNATSIYNYAFAYCPRLTTAIFPNATRIYTSAFAWCSNLLALDFANVTSVGSYAFAYCSALTTANFPNLSSIGTQCFLACHMLKTISLPKLTTIASSAFSGCSSLMSVYLGHSSVINGKAGMFNSTPMAKSTYTGSYGSIYVPASLVDSYKSAMYWSVYSDRITAYEE